MQELADHLNMPLMRPSFGEMGNAPVRPANGRRYDLSLGDLVEDVQGLIPTSKPPKSRWAAVQEGPLTQLPGT